MLFYCLKCRENTGSKKPKVVKKKTGRTMFPWKCEVCGCRKLRFIKEKEASDLLSGLLGL